MAKARITQDELENHQNQDGKQKQEAVIPEAVQQALTQLQQNQQVLLQKNQELEAKLQEKKAEEANVIESAKMAKLKEESDLKKLLGERGSDDKDALNVLTNAELLSVIAEAMETGVNAKLETTVQQHVKSFGEEITGLKSSLDGIKQVVLKQTAMNEVQQMETKYADFNALKQHINQALSMYPGLALEDAYILVKGKIASQVPDDKHTFSERGNPDLTRGRQVDEEQDNGGRPPRRPVNEEAAPTKRGVSGFRSALDSAIDKVMKQRNG